MSSQTNSHDLHQWARRQRSAAIRRSCLRIFRLLYRLNSAGSLRMDISRARGSPD